MSPQGVFACLLSSSDTLSSTFYYNQDIVAGMKLNLLCAGIHF